MRNKLLPNISNKNSTTNYEGGNKMNNLESQIGNVITYSIDPMYLPIRKEHLGNTKVSDIPNGTEVPIYDSIINNHFTLEGKRISIKKEYATRAVIGCVECPEYMVIEDEDLENTTCEDFVDIFLSLVNSKISSLNELAA